MTCTHPSQEMQWVCETCGAREAATYDDPILDGTEGAHPAWWRGDDHGYARGVAAERKRLAHPDARLQRDIDMIAAAVAAERARITAAVETIRPVLTDGWDDPHVSLAAVLRIVNPEEAEG